MNCEEIKEYLYEYHTLRLNRETFYKVDEHLKTCARCQQELKELEETVNLLNRAKPPELSEDFKDKVMARLEPNIIPFYKRRPYRLILQGAIAAVVVLAVVTTIRLTSQPDKESLTRGVSPGVISGDQCKKAIELYNSGTTSNDLAQKERLLKDALAQQCNDKKIQAKIYNNLADCFENQGKLNEAIEGYKRAVELDPELATPHISLGDIYKNKNMHDEARQSYEKGLRVIEEKLIKKEMPEKEKDSLKEELDHVKAELEKMLTQSK